MNCNNKMSKETAVGDNRCNLDSRAANSHDTEMDLVLTRIDCTNLAEVLCFDRGPAIAPADDTGFQASFAIFISYMFCLVIHSSIPVFETKTPTMPCFLGRLILVSVFSDNAFQMSECLSSKTFEFFLLITHFFSRVMSTSFR